MNNRSKYRPATAGLMLLALLTLPATASALDRQEATLVSSATLEVPANFKIDDDIVYVGTAGCEQMLNNNSTVKSTWATTFDPSSQNELVEAFDTFSVARESTARISCEGGDLCRQIPDEDIAFGESSLSAELDFSTLLEHADVTECANFDLEFFFRVTVKETVGGEATEDADAKMIVDTIRPTAPSALEASATENRITVNFEGSPEADVSRYFVFYSVSGFEGGQNPDELDLSSKVLGEDPSGDVAISVQSADSIFVAVAAQDATGNFSPLSGVVEVNIVETNDFWEEYRGAGGSESGGCSTTNANPTSAAGMILLLGMLLMGTRRRRWFIAATFAVALVAMPLTASADTDTFGALELKLGGYYPAIDEEFGGSGPFSDTFGSKNLVMGEIEVDGWIWQGFGKLGVGAHIGFSKVKGNAQAVDAAEQTEVSDTTSFGVIPIRGSLVYRFDWLAQHTRIPLSAGVKVGPDFYRWRIADSNGDTAEVGGESGRGWKKGWHFAAGLQLLLDVLDPGTAAAFDLNWGVNNSYLFAELMMTRVNDFGGEGFDLSDNIWMFGLSFEF